MIGIYQVAFQIEDQNPRRLVMGVMLQVIHSTLTSV